jgi:predicted nucleic acid-binding protein
MMYPWNPGLTRAVYGFSSPGGAYASMMSNQNVRVVAQTTSSFRSGFDLYKTRLDKGYSLTDCISMQTMRDQGITDVLTNDAHFTQEGFRALLRRDQTAR